jgi:hypothetical protein
MPDVDDAPTRLTHLRLSSSSKTADAGRSRPAAGDSAATSSCDVECDITLSKDSGLPSCASPKSDRGRCCRMVLSSAYEPGWGQVRSATVLRKAAAVVRQGRYLRSRRRDENDSRHRSLDGGGAFALGADEPSASVPSTAQVRRRGVRSDGVGRRLPGRRPRYRR